MKERICRTNSRLYKQHISYNNNNNKEVNKNIPEDQLCQGRDIYFLVRVEDSLEGVEYSQTGSGQICSEHQSNDTTRSVTTHNTQVQRGCKWKLPSQSSK